MFDFDSLVYASDIQLIYVSIGIAMFLISRLFLCFAVYNDGKTNENKQKLLWSSLSFLFGCLPAIIYAIVVFSEKRENHKNSKSVLIVIAIVAMILSFNSFVTYELSFTGEFGFLDFDIKFSDVATVTYKNRFGQKVILDKEGNEYTYSQRKALLYYTENGEKYRCIDDVDYFYMTFINTETEERYIIEEYQFYVNDEGFFCIFSNEDDSLEYYENDNYYFYYDDKHLYYPLDFVFWDKDGNVVFSKVNDKLNYLTYDEVVQQN